jgi:hypothetical protein
MNRKSRDSEEQTHTHQQTYPKRMAKGSSLKRKGIYIYI